MTALISIERYVLLLLWSVYKLSNEFIGWSHVIFNTYISPHFDPEELNILCDVVYFRRLTKPSIKKKLNAINTLLQKLFQSIFKKKMFFKLMNAFCVPIWWIKITDFLYFLVNWALNGKTQILDILSEKHKWCHNISLSLGWASHVLTLIELIYHVHVIRNKGVFINWLSQQDFMTID